MFHRKSEEGDIKVEIENLKLRETAMVKTIEDLNVNNFILEILKYQDLCLDYQSKIQIISEIYIQHWDGFSVSK